MTALARLRFPDEASRGRRYPEIAHPYRTPFQRDRDRIVHARAFRRLEDKTQVFPSGLSDHFRNRLTHTIEVAQIARTAAQAMGLNQDLTEALALVHDFGHPPFAHAGEEELDRLMRRHGGRFDHNLHALRIVERLEQRYALFPGLNLTFEVREGMVKHSRDFERGEFPELDEFLPGERPPLEAQLIDLADEIAYNTADLDDAVAAGMIEAEEAAAAVPKFGELWEAQRTSYPGAPEKVQFLETLRGVIDWLVTGLIEGTWRAAEAAGVESVEAVRRHGERLARLSPAAAETGGQLKALLHARVYGAEPLKRERQRSQELIAAMFGRFLEEPGLMPEPYASEARAGEAHRTVCDYIAGMTDGFLLRTARQIQLLG